jgi:hypothetical protein
LQPWAKRLKQLASLISQLEQQQAGGSASASAPAAAAAAGRGEAAATTALPPQPLLTVISQQGSTLTLHVAGLTQLQLAAFQIGTELLFTTQPFSSFNTSNTAAAPVTQLPHRSSHNGGADAGLGRVSFVQPTAKVPLQLQYTGAGTSSGTGAGSTATGSGLSPSVACVVVPCTSIGGSSSDSSSSAGVHECVVDLDAVMPGLRNNSMLLEVTGGGISRTVPR